MSKHFDKFKERINSVTGKFVVAEQSPERMTMFAAEKNLKAALANPTKQFTFLEIRNIWFAFNTLGGEKVNQLAARYPEGTLQQLAKTLDTKTGVPKDIITKSRRLASKKDLEGLRAINSGVIPGFDKIDKAGRMNELLYKDINRFSDTIVDYINRGIPGKQRGAADPQMSIGEKSKFTLGQLKAALDLADGKNVSVREALSEIAKREVTQEEAQQVFDSATETAEALTNQLNKLWDEAQDKVDDLKIKHVNAPEYSGSDKRKENILKALTVSDMFRVKQASGPAYLELKQWSLEGNPSYQQRLINLLPTFEAVADVIAQLMERQDEFATTQAQRRLAYIKKQAELAQARFNKRDMMIMYQQAIANTPGPTRGSGTGEMSRRAYDDALANTPGPTRGSGTGEMSRRAYDDAVANTTGPTRSSGFKEMARRAFDDAIANTPGPTRGDGALETARRAYDTAIANTSGPTRGNYGARLEMSKRAFVKALKNTLDTGRGSGFKEMARRAFDIAIANTTGPTRGSGRGEMSRRAYDDALANTSDTGRGDGYLEMARRAFDIAIANTPGPTRSSGYLEMARRAFDTAIANTPDTGRGSGFKEMARRAYDEALKNTQGPTRGDGALETARRAFDTALKNTLDTGRGSGENEVDRRYIDNVRSDIDQWMAINRVPSESTGGFVGASSPDAEENSAQDQIDAQRNIHREIVNMFDAEEGQARANYILRLTRELDNTESKLLDPANREKYIKNLKQTYVKFKAQEDFLRSQDENETLYYGFNPSNLNSIKVLAGKSEYNLSDSILYSLRLLTQVIPNAIQKHSTKQSVIDANEPVDLDTDQLDQQAQARTAKLDQAAQELRDKGAASAAAGEEELANRDDIRARAEETAEQERERRRIIADQLKTFKEIEAETTSREAAFDAVIEPLDALISNVESDVDGTQIDSLANLQALLDAEYSEKSDIISNALTGKEEFEELDERLYDVIVEKQKQFIEKLDTTFNRLEAETKGDDSGIDSNYIFGVDTAGMRADVDAFSTLDQMPANFVSSATRRIDQIDRFVDTLQRRYNFYNDEFMVLHREVNEVMLSSWDDINNFEYDDLVDLYEDIEELFELSQVTGRSNREQQIVDNKYSTIETNIGKLIRRKASDFGKRAVDVYNSVVTKTRIDAIDIIEGDLVLTPEAFDELYNRRDDVGGLIEEFETVQEFLETVNAEEPEFFVKVQPWLDTLVGFYQKIEEYAASQGGPNRRGSPSDAYRYYKETLGKVREPARAGFAGRGAPSPKARETLSFRNKLRFWDNDPLGLPKADSEGDTSESARKKQHRNDIKNQTPDETRELLAMRRFWQIKSGNFVNTPNEDPFIRTTSEGMRRIDTEFEKGEIRGLSSPRKAAEYLDKLKDQYHG